MSAVEWLIPYSAGMDAWLKLFSLLGIPVSIFILGAGVYQNIQVQRDKMYDDVVSNYVKFQEICISSPKVGCSLYENDILRETLPRDYQIVQDILFDVNTTLCERAFVTFRGLRLGRRSNWWQIWSVYIDEYCSRRNYREWWHRLGPTLEGGGFDARFVKYMVGRFSAAPPPLADGPANARC